MHAWVAFYPIVMTTTASKQMLVPAVLHHHQLGAMQKELDNFTKYFVVQTQE